MTDRDKLEEAIRSLAYIKLLTGRYDDCRPGAARDFIIQTIAANAKLTLEVLVDAEET